jgi:hypothetical protein
VDGLANGASMGGFAQPGSRVGLERQITRLAPINIEKTAPATPARGGPSPRTGWRAAAGMISLPDAERCYQLRSLAAQELAFVPV